MWVENYHLLCLGSIEQYFYRLILYKLERPTVNSKIDIKEMYRHVSFYILHLQYFCWICNASDFTWIYFKSLDELFPFLGQERPSASQKNKIKIDLSILKFCFVFLEHFSFGNLTTEQCKKQGDIKITSNDPHFHYGRIFYNVHC
jgi:hypothetical protein